MRNIVFHDKTKTFHLYNEKISYIMCVLENGHMGQIYFGKKIHDKEDFSYLVEKIERPMTSYIYEWDKSFSLEHIRQEYPVYGTTDYRHPAIELLQKNGAEFQNLNIPAMRLQWESRSFRDFLPFMQNLRKKR